MKTSVFALVSVLLLVSQVALAQQTPQLLPGGDDDGEVGLFRGILVSAEDGSPIANARVLITETRQRATTNSQGQFEIELEEGDYTLAVSQALFATETVDISVTAGRTTTTTIQLEPGGVSLEDVAISSQVYDPGGITETISERRDTFAVVNIIGSEQFRQTGDGDAAKALRRVTGLTLVDDQFVYVRGLGERYTSTLYNGATLPSPDPTRRVIPLGLFPTSIIESILVQKTTSPDRPGEFGGGTIAIRTKALPDSFFFSAKVGLGWRGNTTFEDGFTYDGGDRDFLGFDDGTRDLPDAVESVVKSGNEGLEGLSDEQRETLGESFSNTYDLDEETLNPDTSFSISLGDKRFVGDNAFGFIGSFSYSNSWSTRNELAQDFQTPDGVPNLDAPIFINDSVVTRHSVDTSAFLNLGIEFGQNHTLNLISTLLRQTTDRAEDTFSDQRDRQARVITLEWVETSLWSEQLAGSHIFNGLNGTTLDWQATYAETSRVSPDTREQIFAADEDGNIVGVSTRRTFLTREFDELDDYSFDWSFDFTVPFELTGAVYGDVKFGYTDLTRARDSSIREFTYDAGNQVPIEAIQQDSFEDILTPELIGPNQFELEANTTPTDRYTADQDVRGVYAMVDAFVTDRFRVTTGVRHEESDQNVVTQPIFSGEDAEPDVAKLSTEDVLPSLSATWFISPDMQLRAAYGRSLNRPDFKDLSSQPFIDPETNIVVVGNPDLQTATLDNFDLRWEWYFAGDEYVSAAIFYKDIDQPIETTLSPQGADDIRRTLVNSESAELYGIELEGRKNLDFLGAFFDNFFVASNFAWIDSEVTADAEAFADVGSTVTNLERSLQGQADYVINFQLGYDDPILGINASLLYNRFGERITEVGIDNADDVFEQPFDQLDFVYNHLIGYSWEFSAEVRNILDDEVREERSGVIREAYEPERSFNVSLSYTF